MSAPTVGLALIVRDEQDRLPRLLESVEGAFDRVALLDTGSTDRTVEVFQEWAQAQPDMTFAVGRFEWCDDFAAARTAADALLEGCEWTCWADGDDTIENAERLRAIAASAHPDVAAFIFDYRYAVDHAGNTVCTLKRERLVRAGHGVWKGRVHEAQIIAGPSQHVGPEVCRWLHHKEGAAGPDSNERNLRILTAWTDEEPDVPRVIGYLGTEHAGAGRHDVAIEHFRRYLALKAADWDEERAQVHRKLSASLMALDRPQEALEVALAAFAVKPLWPDNRLSMAEAFYALREHDKACECAREVLRLGQPDSMLILNPLDYTWKPRLLLAAALGALGQLDEALQAGSEALRIVPGHDELTRHMHGWQETVRREHVARTWVRAAQMLVGEDEQLKALALLEGTVPYFAQDHPSVVAARSEIRERLLWVNDPGEYARHYREEPEDFHDDERAVEICDALPRAAFLRDGLAEQMAAAA